MAFRNPVLCGVCAVALAVLLNAPLPADDETVGYQVIAYDVDPPIVIDGDLSDWADIPGEITLEQHAQVTWGNEQWSGPHDLSGRFRLAWRSGGFSIAAYVRDDVVQQPFLAEEIWKGDHINLFLDFIPGHEPERNFWGRGQAQIGFSPGNLADSTTRTPAEAVFFYPAGLRPGGKIKLAARRLKTGYVIEAYIPALLFDDRQLTAGDDFNFLVTISDADNPASFQESWMTPDTRAWVSRRSRLLPAVLGDGSGKGEPAPRALDLAKPFQMQPGDQPHTISFVAPPLSKSRRAYLFFRGRVDYPKVGGNVTGALQLKVNGQTVTAGQLSNREPGSTMRDGRSETFVAPDGRIVLWYSPDFEAVDSDPHYQLIDGAKACEYEFDVTDLIKEGPNTLVFEYLAATVAENDRVGFFDNVELRFRAPVKARTFKPAPEGEIAICEPRVPKGQTYTKTVRPGALRLKAGPETFTVTSRFSSPDGQWNTSSNRFYRHHRKVIEHDQYLEIRDTFENLTDQNVPILQEHRCQLGPRYDQVWLSGIWMPSGNGNRSNPENPSVYVTTKRAGLGMIAINDEFRTHHTNHAAKSDGVVQISDRNFVLSPEKKYTSVLFLVPSADPDFWTFINTARRAMEVNFTIDQLFTFAFYQEPIYKWSNEQLKRFVRLKSANFVVQSNEAARFKGRYAYARAFLAVPRQPYIDFHRRIQKIFPAGDVKHGIYYHCFIDNYDDADDAIFFDARLLDAEGNHLNYGGQHAVDKIYVPTLENRFGRETGKVVDSLLEEIGVDGIFWDEWTQCRVPYTYNDTVWDGCSADIDPDTFQITRLKSSVALVSLPWRVEKMKKMLARGPVMTNGSPHTLTMQKLGPQAFTETGTISYCREMLLYTPIGLGDHLTVRTQTDAYRSMLRQLDHGCLYAWYAHEVIPTHPTLTEHMFPFTPIELHEGYVIGEERILTNRSGYFGWGDSSRFSTYVYDREGKRTQEIEVPSVERAGNTYAEVRIPEGYSAAIVRQ